MERGERLHGERRQRGRGKGEGEGKRVRGVDGKMR